MGCYLNTAIKTALTITSKTLVYENLQILWHLAAANIALMLWSRPDIVLFLLRFMVQLADVCDSTSET